MKWARFLQLDAVQASKVGKKAWFQSWVLGAISYRGIEQNVEVLRCASTADKNRAPAPAVRQMPGLARICDGRSESRGYTIIEVLIVLAISSAILTSSVALFGGRRGETEFPQAVYDLQSKLQSYAAQVSSAALPSGEAYSCGVSGLMPDGKVYPVLTTVSVTAEPTTNQDCIYLGQAVQIIPTGDTLYAYPVYGLRTIHNGAVDSGDFPSTAAQANPEPALDADGKFLLVEPYQLLNGLRVVFARLSGSTAEQDLLTLYSSLQSSNTSGNEIIATSLAAEFFQADIQSSSLRSCIEAGSCAAGGAVSLINQSWDLCVRNASGDKQAQLAVQATATGITTRLNLEGCS